MIGGENRNPSPRLAEGMPGPMKPSRTNTLERIGPATQLLVCCIVWGWMILLIAIRYPDNHGASPEGYRVFFFTLLVLSCFHILRRNRLSLAVFILAAIGLISTWVIDHRNIMVDYYVWIERGMPAWGESSGDAPPPNDRRRGSTKSPQNPNN